jgi:hypothetical protein
MPKQAYDSIPPPPVLTDRAMLTSAATWIRTEQALGKLVGFDLNQGGLPKQGTLFTAAIPADCTGYVVTRIVKSNYSTAATTASVSFGQTATPTDWAATAVDANAATTSAQILTATAALQKFYKTNGAFVANLTIAQGGAATCDIEAFGYYT